MRVLILLAATCVVAGLSCKENPEARQATEGPAPPPAAPVAPAPAAPATVEPPAAAAPTGKTIEHTAIPSASVRELLADSALVGLTVRVAGTCLGYGALEAEGTPPLTRSDWQLEDEGFAIWVSGPLPAGCSPTAGATTRTLLVARVAQDSLRVFGSKTAKLRRYLLVVGE